MGLSPPAAGPPTAPTEGPVDRGDSDLADPSADASIARAEERIAHGDPVGGAMALIDAAAALAEEDPDRAQTLRGRAAELLAAKVTPFTSNEGYLLAEVHYLRQLLSIDALTQERTGSPGMLLDIAEMTFVLTHADAARRATSGMDRDVQSAWENARAMRGIIDHRFLLAVERDRVPIPLMQLSARLELTNTDWMILLVLAAPVLAPDLYDLYRRSWRDAAKRRPDVWFVARLLHADAATRRATMQRLAPDAPLVRHGLVRVYGGDGERTTLLPFRQVTVPSSVADFICGRVSCDQALAARGGMTSPAAPEALAPVSLARQRELVGELVALAQTTPRRSIVLHGPSGAGKRTAVRLAASQAKRPLLTVRLTGADRADAARLVTVAVRDAILHGAWLQLVVELAGGAEAATDAALLRTIAAGVAPDRVPIVITIEAELGLASKLLGDARILRLAPPSLSEHAPLWVHAFERAGMIPPSPSAIASGTSTGLTPGDIQAAVSLIAAEHGDPGSAPSPGTMRLGVRGQLQSNLSELARLVSTRLSWTDIVLPDDVLERIMDVVTHVRYSDRVLEDWGFGRKFTRGRGQIVLFSGPSGTGKTTVAALLAQELGIDVFQVELSRMVSKYIGETEKNLALLFDEAERVGAGLLFDEADSVFGKRSSGSSSTDRYANMETNYLLQRVEETDCLVILTTNFAENIDDAFMRRIRFNIRFPFPDESAREELWRSQLPPEAKLAEDVNFAHLAKDYELSGGRIRNALLNAAFRAVERGEPIGMAFLEATSRDEYRAMGRLVRDP